MKKVHSSFLPERVRPYWNKLPSDVKNCGTVLSFKIRLEAFKKETILNGSVNDSHFWYVSDKVLGKIEGLNYATNKEKHNEYLMCNPHVGGGGGGSTSFYLILPHPNFAFFGCPNEVK